MDEARLIRDVLRFVGGPPVTTRRGLADAVHARLDEFLGAAPLPMPDVKSAVYMTDAPRSFSLFERERVRALHELGAL